MISRDDVHDAAHQGFGAAADAYARGRPGYPPELVGWLRDALAIGPGRRAVDLGAGTGKFTGLLAHPGASVAAVEPVPAMRREFVARHPGVEIVDGTAEALPFPDASVDAVACAQAFHWFATQAALAEIRRVLKPGGALGLVWNVRDESVGWVRELGALMRPFEGDAPRFHSGAWQKVFPAEGFGPLETTRFQNPQTGDPEQLVVDRTLSVSFIARLPAAKRADVEARVRRLVAETPELRGGGEVTFPYETSVYRTVKTG